MLQNNKIFLFTLAIALGIAEASKINGNDVIALEDVSKENNWVACQCNDGDECRASNCPLPDFERSFETCSHATFKIVKGETPSSTEAITSGTGVYLLLADCTSYGVVCLEANHLQCTAKENERAAKMFIIYAKGKAIGDDIETGDRVILFNIDRQRWLDVIRPRLALSGYCDAAKAPIPPNDQTYKTCWGSVAKIHKEE